MRTRYGGACTASRSQWKHFENVSSVCLAGLHGPQILSDLRPHGGIVMSQNSGAVTVRRCALRAPGEPNIYPADAALSLPAARHSHGLLFSDSASDDGVMSAGTGAASLAASLAVSCAESSASLPNASAGSPSD